jgi:hypothetical protein
LIDWLFTVLRSAQDFLKKILWKRYRYRWRITWPILGALTWPLRREKSWLCFSCCDSGPWFFRSYSKDRPIKHSGKNIFMTHYHVSLNILTSLVIVIYHIMKQIYFSLFNWEGC